VAAFWSVGHGLVSYFLPYVLTMSNVRITDCWGSEMISQNSETFQTMLNSQLKALQDLASVDRTLKGGFSSAMYSASHLFTTFHQITSTTKNKVENYRSLKTC
jgi:hypothetical protein